jgi:hypothetical protein
VPGDVARLTVSEIRQRIFETSGTESMGAGSLAGQLFHRTAACALEPEHPACWRAVLGEDLNAEEWARKLYEEALGPELVKLQAPLSENGAEVMAVWQGIGSFAGWFCGLLAEAQRARAISFDKRKEEWTVAPGLFETECDLSIRLREPGWTQAVEVAGRADQLIRAGRDRWCVVEFKLGGGHPESDAAQACLYHELLGGGAGSAALVRFGQGKEPEQIVLSGDLIRQARPALMKLIGAMAGVDAKRAPANDEGHGAKSWPRAASEAEIELGRRMIGALQEFQADARLVEQPLVGPTFVRFLLEPGRGVGANRIEKQGPNLQLRLQLEQEPMISRKAGRIAVDVQRPEREYVPFSSLGGALAGERRPNGNSRLLAGVDLMGVVHFVDLARDAPHLLVGGIPGGGKSEWLRSAVASLLVTNTPQSLRLVLIDPKKNAFADLAQSEYLWRPDALVDSPEGKVIPLLQDLIEEMQRRYALFKVEKSDDLGHYAGKAGPDATPPRLVCVVDEFADLLLAGRKAERDEIERGFVRIAQLGRAAGVHLILATQRPSRQVVSGMLKANIPGKIALRVANRVESMVLLDRGGAQNLLGRGDLLLSAGSYDLVRLQSAYLSDEDRRGVFGSWA